MLTAACLFVLAATYGQPLSTVTGNVTDSAGKGLEGVTVKVKGGKGATVTNAEGAFLLSVPRPGVTLVFSAVGFSSKEIRASSASMRVSLERVIDNMQDVIIVGYTQQSRARTTAAVSKLGPDEMKNAVDANPVLALQGKMAGVNVPVSSGQPGASPARTTTTGASGGSVASSSTVMP